MNIAITGLTGIREAVIASGIKHLLEGMSLGVTVEVAGAVSAPAPVAPAAEIPAPKKRGRKPGVKVAPKPAKVARKQAVKPAAAAPIVSGGGRCARLDPRRCTRGTGTFRTRPHHDRADCSAHLSGEKSRLHRHGALPAVEGWRVRAGSGQPVEKI